MTRAKKLAFYALAALLAGCVPIFSLHPLFTTDDLTFDEKLVGTWVEDSNDPNEIWEFSRLGEADAVGFLEPLKDDITKFYRLSISGDEALKCSLVACLVKLGDRRFLDIFPDRFPSGGPDIEKDMHTMESGANVIFFLPVHTFFRVDSIGDRLAFSMTDDVKFKDLIEADPNAVKHDIVNDSPLLTSSTKELQAFVTKYADGERLFSNDMTLIRKVK